MKIQKGLLLLSLWLVTELAMAHAMGSSFLHLTEASPGKFTQLWVPAKQVERLVATVEPSYPQQCVQQGPQSIVVIRDWSVRSISTTCQCMLMW